MASNSFLHPIDELRFGTYKPADVGPALDICEKLAWERIEKLLKISADKRNFENTVLALANATEEFDLIAHIAGHLDSVLGGKWRKSTQLANKRASDLYNKLNFHEGVYRAILVLSERKQYIKSLSKPRQKLLKETIKSYERNGITLAESQKTRLKEIRSKLNKATTKFGQNEVAANDKAGLLVKSKTELAGMDEDFISTCEQIAREKGVRGYWIQYNEPNYLKVMGDCGVPETRHDFYRVAISKNNPVNYELCLLILSLRKELASILGYQNYADYVLEERMAKRGDTARAFINNLSQYYRPRADEEFKKLENFAREYEKNPDFKLDASDTASMSDFYYGSKLREQSIGISGQAIREHLPLESVLKCMFSTLSTLYGIKFKKVKEPSWHQDVAVYEISNNDGTHLATVWCDWFAREGKRSGAWMDAFFIADRPEGVANQPHLGCVCANLDKPKDDKPSLLTLEDAEMVWHEFGHFIHLAVSKNELKEQNMLNCVWDFIEAPSQIMENWVWQPEILKKMAKHYKTGEAIPDSMVEKLVADQSFMAANRAMRQFNLAETDLALHMDFNPKNKKDLLPFIQKIKEQFLPQGIRVYPEDAWVLSFTHVFAGGYACAYYSYKWAEAIEADLFSRFKEEGVLNPKTGGEYRDKILARGNEEEPQVLVENFLGRHPTIGAMLARDGIKVEKDAPIY